MDDEKIKIVRVVDPHINNDLDIDLCEEESISENEGSSRNIKLEDDSFSVSNLSAFWIPEITLEKEIGGTVYTVSGTYEGNESFLRKLDGLLRENLLKKLMKSYDK